VTALIFNTSPLSHFARAGRLALLDRLTAAYRRVVPQAVLDELRAGELAHPPLADVGNADWLEIVACDGLAELRTFAHYVRVLVPVNGTLARRRCWLGPRSTVESQ
jgi:hypothetical protein